MDFHEVTFDSIDDMEREDLEDLVLQYEKAQNTNLEQLEDVTAEVGEFEEFESELTEDLVELTSLSEEAASALPFSEKRSLIEDVSVDETEEEDAEFEDRGTKGETQPEGNESGVPDHVAEAFSSISGANL